MWYLREDFKWSILTDKSIILWGFFNASIAISSHYIAQSTIGIINITIIPILRAGWNLLRVVYHINGAYRRSDLPRRRSTHFRTETLTRYQQIDRSLPPTQLALSLLTSWLELGHVTTPRCPCSLRLVSGLFWSVAWLPHLALDLKGLQIVAQIKADQFSAPSRVSFWYLLALVEASTTHPLSLSLCVCVRVCVCVCVCVSINVCVFVSR